MVPALGARGTGGHCLFLSGQMKLVTADFRSRKESSAQSHIALKTTGGQPVVVLFGQALASSGPEIRASEQSGSATTTSRVRLKPKEVLLFGKTSKKQDVRYKLSATRTLKVAHLEYQHESERFRAPKFHLYTTKFRLLPDRPETQRLRQKNHSVSLHLSVLKRRRREKHVGGEVAGQTRSRARTQA